MMICDLPNERSFTERPLMSDETPLAEAAATSDLLGEPDSFRSAVRGSSDFNGRLGRGHHPFEPLYLSISRAALRDQMINL